MKKQYTKEEKQAYFQGLRNRWKSVKASITEDMKTQVSAIMAERGLDFSITAWMIVEQQMRALNYEGLPYVDTKTYKGWQETGFKVKRGEKSQIMGITWIGGTKKEDDKNTEENEKFIFPKVYHLFHRSQVMDA